MQSALVIMAFVLALAWLPLVWKFQTGWRNRRNPVSLAICATLLALAYKNVVFAFALKGEASWRFFGRATLIFDAVAIVNFYVSFYWANKKFPTQRKPSDTSPPPQA